MKKIISLYQRNYEGDRLVRDEVVPGAEWVLAGDGFATRKLDGTAMLVEASGRRFKRLEVKGGRVPPPEFRAAQPPDPVTGDVPGWVPVRDGPEDRWHREAILDDPRDPRPTWTYELLGPKVQGNPEGVVLHLLRPHGLDRLGITAFTFAGLREYFERHNIEGIVWWRSPDLDADKVKIKAKDFGIRRVGRDVEPLGSPVTVA